MLSFADIQHIKKHNKMSEEILERELEVYTLEDENGKEQDYYIEDKIEFEGKTYCSLYPYYETEDEMDNAPENVGVYIMEYLKDDASVMGIEDEELYNKVEQKFREMDEALKAYGQEN